ncbi:hypothetical protein [Streptomyces acidiscabies]|uniref:hypothetical protein n=1 Tax=Streptomyces acidiscabies TaxID=42234 RepID=UPI0038F7B3DA
MLSAHPANPAPARRTTAAAPNSGVPRALLPGSPRGRPRRAPDASFPCPPYGRAGVGRVMAAGRCLVPVHGPRRPPPTRVASAPHHPAAGNRTTLEGETR